MEDIPTLMALASALGAKAIEVFKPATPITTRDLFAGRWGELTSISDAVRQAGLHALIYGERGVGKTSLANVVRPTLWALDAMAGGYRPDDEDAPMRRLVINCVANSSDTFSSIWERLLGDIVWPGKTEDTTLTTREAFRLPDHLRIDDVRRVLAQTNGAVFIIDEFDQAQAGVSRQFTELIKALSDLAIDCTIVLVGVSETVDNLSRTRLDQTRNCAGSIATNDPG